MWSSEKKANLLSYRSTKRPSSDTSDDDKKRTKDVPNIKSILRVMIEHEIVWSLRTMLRGNKQYEHFAKQWGESTEEKMRQLQEKSNRGEKYYDMIQFVATRLTDYLDKIHFFHNNITMTMEDKKRAIEALLDLCVKKVLTYWEKGYYWNTSNWQRGEADNLDKELAELLSKTVKELARE